MDPLVEEFVAAQKEAHELLAKGEAAKAKEKYLAVLEIYHKIDKSALEQFHKELAYDQVNALFSEVNQAREHMKIPYNLVVAGLLILALGTGVFLKPSIVGLVGLDDLVRQEVNVNLSSSSIRELTLRDHPLSLAASGEFTGHVKLFQKEGEQLRLVYASNGTAGTFTDACAETCTISTNSNVVELFAQVQENASLFVREISYRVEHKRNTAPHWQGANTNFRATVGRSTTIDLSDYFADDESDPLVFLSTTGEGINVEVQNSNITLTPTSAGTKNLLFIASDLIAVTRVPVTIEAQ
ncbi:MAG TPA: hypothetical protein VJJ82_01460 [Candidatus Nanoarchaeia archaeon]|nr:hypothetical protein [Candidatus Nanoarchaeia archaeon]